MTLKLYTHPLSSFCWKVHVAFYENGTPFEQVIVNFGEEESRNAFFKLWPPGKIPVLVDTERNDWMVPESSIIIEYLDQHHPGAAHLLPKDADLARQVRMRDRFFDLYVQVPMQKIVSNRLRPPDGKDAIGGEDARRMLKTALDLIEQDMTEKSSWLFGEDFTMADCAACPALWYANEVLPFAGTHPHAFAYLRRLMARPSFARVLKESEPYRHLFPREAAQ